jgi:IclR family KDG regulon transcriptional repressor
MPRTSSKPKNEYAIQTVTNALRMLEVFHDETELGVSDLARRLGLHKNNAFRLLATLELAGYIQQTPATELYHLGPRCLELGQAFARSHSLLDRARPILQALAAEYGETAHIGVLRGMEVVHLDGALPDQLVLSGLRVGTRLGAHCTALGKVLLAGELGHFGPAGGSLSPAGTDAIDAAQVLRSGAPLEQHTPATLADPAKLVEELRSVQLRGYGVDVDEYALGLRCVAAPVRDGGNRVVAALSLSGPASRLDEEALHGPIADAVIQAADRLSAAIGAA